MGYCNEGCWGDTFMSRDTLRTGRPLPGWPGRTPPKSEDGNKCVLAKCATMDKTIDKVVLSYQILGLYIFIFFLKS